MSSFGEACQKLRLSPQETHRILWSSDYESCFVIRRSGLRSCPATPAILIEDSNFPPDPLGRSRDITVN